MLQESDEPAGAVAIGDGRRRYMRLNGQRSNRGMLLASVVVVLIVIVVAYMLLFGLG
jgi:hypothetical protein